MTGLTSPNDGTLDAAVPMGLINANPFVASWGGKETRYGKCMASGYVVSLELDKQLELVWRR